jgi:hypothetical protein
MRRTIAHWLNERGSIADDTGNKDRGRRLQRLASLVDPNWSVPWYNLGLSSKYAGMWEESLRFNQRASALNPKDEAAWWNLGIAATALRNWPEARRAWRGFGIDIPDSAGEVEMPVVTACVRLDPNRSGEVVWGDRIDPARIILLNVPLPESGHRFHDIVLHDGAANGSRTRDGADYPVFDELGVWQPSNYSTFEVSLNVPNEAAEDRLIEFCRGRRIGIEDWSTIRIICAECSRGNPAPHNCTKQAETTGRPYALAAKSEDDLRMLLTEWVAATPGAECGAVDLVLPGSSSGEL